MQSKKVEPRASRPVMPKGYGIRPPRKKNGLLSWEHVVGQMEGSRNYWVSTTRPDGRPHVMPVWGVWVAERLCFGTDRGSRKARNLAANPAIVIHLESGDEVVILEGVAAEETDPARLAAIDDAYFAKYQMRVIGFPGDMVIYSTTPRTAFAWREQSFNQSATRWIFP